MRGDILVLLDYAVKAYRGGFGSVRRVHLVEGVDAADYVRDQRDGALAQRYGGIFAFVVFAVGALAGAVLVEIVHLFVGGGEGVEPRQQPEAGERLDRGGGLHDVERKALQLFGLFGYRVGIGALVGGEYVEDGFGLGRKRQVAIDLRELFKREVYRLEEAVALFVRRGDCAGIDVAARFVYEVGDAVVHGLELGDQLAYGERGEVEVFEGGDDGLGEAQIRTVRELAARPIDYIRNRFIGHLLTPLF